MHNRKPWFFSQTFMIPAIVFCVVLIAISGYGVTKLSLATDYKIFFDRENKDLMSLEKIEEMFTKIDNLFIMVAPPNDVYSTNTLTVIHEMTEAIWKMPNVSRVDSLTNFPYSHAVNDEIVIDNFIYESDQITPELSRWIAQVAPQEKDLIGSLVSLDSRYVGINITTSMPGVKPKEETLETAVAVSKLVSEFQEVHPDYQFFTTGTVAMNAEFVKAAKQDFLTLVPLMIALVLIGSALILGSISAAVAILAVLLLSLVGALGAAGWLGIQLSAPSISAPIIMFTVIVASSIHLISGVKRGLLNGKNKFDAVVEAYQHHTKPIVVSLVTTIVGFLSMNLSDSPPFRDLGNIVALGVIFALLMCFLVLPKLLMSLNISIKGRSFNSVIRSINGLAGWVINHQKLIRLGLIPLALTLAILGLFNTPNDDLIKYFNKDVPFRAESEEIDRHFSAIYNIGYSFDSQVENGVFEPEYLAFIERFQSWLENQSEVKFVDSALHRIKHLNRLIHDGDDSFYAIPESKELTAQYFLLYEMSLPFGQDVAHQITFDKRAMKVTARLSNMSSLEMTAFEQKTQAWLANNMNDNLEYMHSSPALIFSKISQANVVSLLEGAFMAFMMISITLAFIFRSAFIGLLTLLPNLLPIGIAFGCWYLLNGQISMGLAGVSAMAIGIIVDDTVHFLHQYINGIKQGNDPEASIRRTFERTMTAIFISSILLMVGFILLTTSSFEKNAQMGMLTGTTILLALFFDLVVLPAIALKFLRRVPSATSHQEQTNTNKYKQGAISHEI